MRGFVLGTMTLIVLEALLQPGAAEAAGQGGNVLVGLLQRLLSPQVAGIPNVAHVQLPMTLGRKLAPNSGGPAAGAPKYTSTPSTPNNPTVLV